jgi:hypothetical protein
VAGPTTVRNRFLKQRRRPSAVRTQPLRAAGAGSPGKVDLEYENTRVFVNLLEIRRFTGMAHEVGGVAAENALVLRRVVYTT